jgi:hypothetical protein
LGFHAVSNKEGTIIMSLRAGIAAGKRNERRQERERAKPMKWRNVGAGSYESGSFLITQHDGYPHHYKKWAIYRNPTHPIGLPTVFVDTFFTFAEAKKAAEEIRPI